MVFFLYNNFLYEKFLELILNNKGSQILVNIGEHFPKRLLVMSKL